MREINHIPFVDGAHYSTKESWQIVTLSFVLLVVITAIVQLV